MSKVTQLHVEDVEKIDFLKNLKTGFNNASEMLIARAAEIPDKTYAYFYEETISYSQMNSRANRVAAFLSETGVKKGDIISFIIPNSPEIHYTIFGAQKLGVAVLAINFILQAPEIAYQIDDAKPSVIFVSSDCWKVFSSAYSIAKHKPVVVILGDESVAGEVKVRTSLKNILESYPDAEQYRAYDSETPALLLYSSGTTGNPKGIVIPHRALLSVGSSMSRLFMTGDGDVFLMLLPMFHSNPLCIWTYAYMFGGGAVCIRKSFSPADFWPSVLEYGITLVLAVPAMYNYIFHSVDPSKIDRSKLGLKYAGCGAAPLPVELLSDFQEKFGVKILEGYGLTEAAGVSTMNPPYGEIRPGSIGFALPGQEIRLLDDSGNEVENGSVGEICVKGDTVMSGYLNRSDATAETLANGWLHTGDMGYADKDGYLYMSGRKKEMINRGGENIYPREIETVLEGNPKIKEVAVIGVPDEALGERVKAFVIPVEPGTLTESEIKEYLKDKLAKYKLPEFVEITGSLPMTATGKIMKKELVEMEKEKYRKSKGL